MSQNQSKSMSQNQKMASDWRTIKRIASSRPQVLKLLAEIQFQHVSTHFTFLTFISCTMLHPEVLRKFHGSSAPNLPFSPPEGENHGLFRTKVWGRSHRRTNDAGWPLTSPWPKKKGVVAGQNSCSRARIHTESHRFQTSLVAAL